MLETWQIYELPVDVVEVRLVLSCCRSIRSGESGDIRCKCSLRFERARVQSAGKIEHLLKAMLDCKRAPLIGSAAELGATWPVV